MKRKITISLEEDVAEKLRLKSIEKYGNARSFSLYIEDLASGAPVEPEVAAACPLGFRTELSLRLEKEFNQDVETIKAQILKIAFTCEYTNLPHLKSSSADSFFTLKEACEQVVNQAADQINGCWECAHLTGPVPKYESAGKNFELYAMLHSEAR